MRRLFSVRTLTLAAALGLALAAALGGFAYWTTPGSGANAQTVSGLTDPSPAATSPTYGAAHVAWSAVTLDPAVPSVDTEVTFTVERKPASASSWVFVCGTGTTPKPYTVLSCDDSPPATDTYDYRVTAALRSWTSPGVASVSVIVDTTAPTSAAAFPTATVYGASGWNAGCASSVCGSATDTGGSDLQKVELSIRRGAGNYWNGSSFASASEVWNLATGTSSWSHGFPASSFPADGPYTVSSRATDNALNVQSPVSSVTFTVDTTPPSVTASTIAATTGTSPPGFVKQGAGYKVYADVSDTSGVSVVSADVSSVTAGQTAAALAPCASSCTIAGHTYAYVSATLTASNPLGEGSKSYTVTGTDVVGNTSAPATYGVFVDNTSPSVTTVIGATTGASPQGFVKAGGTYRVYANVTDLPAGAGASSGVNAASITANVSTVSTGQTAVALTSCGGCGPGAAYAYQSAQLTADAGLSEGNKLYSASASDNLGTTGSSSSANVQVDNTSPSVTTVIANTTTGEAGWLAQGGGYRVYANVSDLPAGAGAASGLDATSITTDVSSVTTGLTAVALTTSGCPCTVGGTTYSYRSALLTASNPLAVGAKSFTTSASDNLGSATAQGGSVTIDNTAPTLSTLQMFDTDSDGKVDQAKATFGEMLETPYSAPNTVWTLANAPGGASNTLSSVSVATTVATLTLSEGNVNTASGSFTIALAANANGIRDLAGNQSSFVATSVADKAAPVPTNVTLNNASTAGRARATDYVVVTYSEALDATSLCSTWSNGSTQTITGSGVVGITIANGATDLLSVTAVGSNCGGPSSFAFGVVNLAANYVGSDTVFSGSTPSSLVWSPSAKTLTLTLGTGNGSQTGVGVSTPVYTPSAAIKDLAGNTMSASAFSAPATSRF